MLLVVVLLLDHLIQLNDNFLILSGLDPLSAIGFGLGAVSSIGNTLGSVRSNSQNMKINRMNNEFNAREAGQARGKGDIAKGGLDQYNFSSRYWDTGIESIGRIGMVS